jgi:hypothetical protein
MVFKGIVRRTYIASARFDHAFSIPTYDLRDRYNKDKLTIIITVSLLIRLILIVIISSPVRLILIVIIS